MVFEKVNFNEAHWKTKTEAEFISHESHHGLGEKKLKEAFALMNPKPQKVQRPPEGEKQKKVDAPIRNKPLKD